MRPKQIGAPPGPYDWVWATTSLTLSNLLMACLIGTCIVSAYYGITSFQQNGRQDARMDAMEQKQLGDHNALLAADTAIIQQINIVETDILNLQAKDMVLMGNISDLGSAIEVITSSLNISSMTGMNVVTAIQTERDERIGNQTALFACCANTTSAVGSLIPAIESVQQCCADNSAVLDSLNMTVQSCCGNNTVAIQNLEQCCATNTAMIEALNMTSVSQSLQQCCIDNTGCCLNNTIAIQNERADRMSEDAVLFSNLTSYIDMQISIESTARIANDTATMAMFVNTVKTVNGLSPVMNNIDIVSSNSGINITNSGSTITVTHNGVRRVNGLYPDVTGTVLLTGASGIGVTTGPMSNEVTFDGSVIETAVNNLDMTVMNQAATIANLTAQIASLQAQLAAVQISAALVNELLNGTTINFNVTVTQLLVQIANLNVQVTNLQSLVGNSSGVPIGGMMHWGGTSAPSGWLMCDGSSVSQSVYATLFTAIGCAYCPMATCTMSNFCLPDGRGKVLVGLLDMDTNFGIRGQQSGAATHTLTATEMPTHSHTINVNDPGHSHTASSGGDHVHDLRMTSNNGQTYPFGSFTNYDCSGYSYTGFGSPSIPGTGQYANVWFARGAEIGGCPSGGINYPSSALLNGAHSHSITSSTTGVTASANSAGSGAAHNNVQPSLTVGGVIIRAI